MKKVLMLCGVACLIACNCFAQQRELDSLLNAYNSYQKEDTIKLNLLLDIVFDCSFIDPVKGLAKADEAILLSQKINNEPKLATAYNYKGVNYEAKGDNELALQSYKKALETRKKLADSIGIAKVLHNMGIVYFNLADYPKALQFQNESLTIFKKLKYTKGIAGDVNSIGVIYLSIADYPNALKSYFESLKINEELNNKHEIAIAYNNIGLVHYHLSEYDKALQYLFNALKIYEENGNKNDIQKTFGNIGNCYNEKNDTEKALAYYQKALGIAKQVQFMPGIASAYANMSVVYNKIHDYPKSLQCSQDAASLYKKLGNKLGLENSLNQIGLTYLSSTENKSDIAIKYFNEVQQLAKETGTIEMEGEAFEHLSEAFSKQKKFDKALEAYKKYIILRDSVINDDKKQEIARLEMQYEFDKQKVIANAERDKKQALANVEINKQKVVRNAIAGGAVILLLASIISFAFYKKRRDAKQHQQEAEIKAQVSDTEMKALRSQMNPHFIFNSLNSINDYISRNNLQAADNYLTKFAKLMRLVLENSEQKEVSLADDLKALELYMQLESLRLNNKFTYEIKIDPAIDKENTQIPPLILQPFVENSIWHGIAKKEGSGKINISIQKEGDMINCTVDDDGVGLKQGVVQLAQRKSLGMKITTARIDILNKTKNANASVKLFSLPQGTRAELKLPLKLSF